MIPIAIVLGSRRPRHATAAGTTRRPRTPRAGGLLFAGPLLMILFRKKYPRWWFDWNRELLRFIARVDIYLVLMNDQYPSTDEQQCVHLEIEYPNVEGDLGRGMPLVKWFLAIPHYIVLFFLHIGAFVRRDHRLVRDPVHRALPEIDLRLRRRGAALAATAGAAYAFILVTDKYPPFSLE